MTNSYTVRRAGVGDATALIGLMRALARFEGYLDQFRVTETDLLERGLDQGPRQEFTALVADDGSGGLLGYAVVCSLPFTYDLLPNLLLKELYVDETSRGLGIGRALMTAVMAEGRARGCARLKWDVLKGNTRAQAFYRSLGGAPDGGWEGWIRQLA
ncbi:GNAT family N-acetyltransferase [Janthinobacterium sp. PSPC3-1]|uniref:GNAT family N-acetyltransferase n=1 Tax=Janthinobacterium sp. PSPC3-1 TaxID=2804653 RepID=UPI003CFB17EA